MNCHTTNRSQKTRTVGGTNVGGAVLQAASLPSNIEACHTMTRDGSNWKCVLDFPSSLEAGDGVHLKVSSIGTSKNEAMDNVCSLALAHLLLRGPWQVACYILNA